MRPLSALPTRAVARLLGIAAGVHAVTGVRTAERAVALTFDDGPDPEETPPLLDLLARHGARATFFLVGARAARHPGLVARLRAEGHAIGNHAWDHPSLPRLDAGAIADQLRRTDAVLQGAPGRLMRPPYGDQSRRSHRVARGLGLTVVGWSVVPGDWSGEDAGTIAARLEAGLRPGAIVLLHDTLATSERPAFRDRAPMRAALAGLLAGRPGWRFVTVPELLALGPPRRRPWVRATDPAALARLEPAPDLSAETLPALCHPLPPGAMLESRGRSRETRP